MGWRNTCQLAVCALLVGGHAFKGAVFARSVQTGIVKIDTREGVRELTPRFAHYANEFMRLSTVWDSTEGGRVPNRWHSETGTWGWRRN